MADTQASSSPSQLTQSPQNTQAQANLQQGGSLEQSKPSDLNTSGTSNEVPLGQTSVSALVEPGAPAKSASHTTAFVTVGILFVIVILFSFFFMRFQSHSIE
jgi:hypothetical protein